MCVLLSIQMQHKKKPKLTPWFVFYFIYYILISMLPRR